MRRTIGLQVGVMALSAALLINFTQGSPTVMFNELAPPTNIRVEAGNNAIKVMWDASLDEAGDGHGGYTVYFATRSFALPSVDRPGYALEVGRGVHECVVRGLENGRKYFFRVSSRNIDGGIGASGQPETAAAPQIEGKNYSVHMYDYNVSTTTSSSAYGWVRENGQAISRLHNVTQHGQYVDILMMELPSAKNRSMFISPSEAAFTKNWPLRNKTLIADIGTNWAAADSLPDAMFTTTAEIKSGHIYVLKTSDNYYVKLRINSIEEVNLLLHHEEKRRDTNINKITFTYASMFGQSSGDFLRGTP